MGFEEDARIILDSPNNTYYAGQTVHGKLKFQRDKVKKFRGIYVRMRGFCKVHWTEQHSRRVNDRTEHYTVTHESFEEYFDQKIFLAGGTHGDHHINAGSHEYPFSIRIPNDCPSAFEGSHGHVRYTLQVVVDRAFKTDQEISHPIRVMAPLDLNQVPGVKDPIDFQFHDSYCCWCVSSGNSETLVKIPVSGFCPGQIIPVEISCTNRSNVEIEKIKLAVKKEVTFHAKHQPGTKHDRSTILELNKGPVPGNSSRNWSLELEVPALDIYNMLPCSYIDIDYELKVTVSPEGCHDDSEDTNSIIFGTVPLAGYQDNVQNPLHNQLPQPTHTETTQHYPASHTVQGPVVNQPVTQYPGSYPGSPYPTGPYPGANPYPNNPAPYPNPTASPYPNPTASPFPNPAPYPNPTASPYPPNPTVSPYPPNPTASPYPPNPTASPYPNPVVSPYPNQPPPSTSPYPPNSSPYQTGPSPLKTGTVGFIASAGMPQLPPGAGVPYQPPNVSPYAASAPVPSTPDDKNPTQPDCSETTSPPAFNPAFAPKAP